MSADRWEPFSDAGVGRSAATSVATASEEHAVSASELAANTRVANGKYVGWFVHRTPAHDDRELHLVAIRSPALRSGGRKELESRVLPLPRCPCAASTPRFIADYCLDYTSPCRDRELGIPLGPYSERKPQGPHLEVDLKRLIAVMECAGGASCLIRPSRATGWFEIYSARLGLSDASCAGVRLAAL